MAETFKYFNLISKGIPEAEAYNLFDKRCAAAACEEMLQIEQLIARADLQDAFLKFILLTKHKYCHKSGH